MQFSAPAKVNLSLRVKGKREDGFHEIETLIVPIDLRDELSFEPSEVFRFVCDDPSLPSDDTNLVVRTARRFAEQTGKGGEVSIRLRKGIPHGAGLGGGSSDAATTLLGLNELYRTGLTIEDLVTLGSEIGSDVPFFLYRSAAWCRGRGELVRPEASQFSLNLVLLKPEFGVAASFAYQRWQSSRELPDFPYDQQSFNGISFFNDLERPVFEKFPILAELKRWLLAQAEVAVGMMSGSGSTMIAVLREGQASGEGLIERARAEIDPMLWGATCRSL